ncbi:MAG: hypothetical protein AAFY26_13900 [Cyanobacteria bacterium J06638_22]
MDEFRTLVGLVGEELVQKVRELSAEMPPVPPNEMARRCGYYTVASDQQVHVNETEFYKALLSTRAASQHPPINTPPPIDIPQIPRTEEGAVDTHSPEYLRVIEELRQRHQSREGAFDRLERTEEP